PRRVARRADAALAAARDAASGEAAAAISTLVDLVERDTDAPAAYLALADLGARDRARAALGLARDRRALGDGAGARRALDEHLVEELNDAAAWRLYAELLEEGGEPAKAAEALKRGKG